MGDDVFFFTKQLYKTGKYANAYTLGFTAPDNQKLMFYSLPISSCLSEGGTDYQFDYIVSTNDRYGPLTVHLTFSTATPPVE